MKAKFLKSKRVLPFKGGVSEESHWSDEEAVMLADPQNAEDIEDFVLVKGNDTEEKNNRALSHFFKQLKSSDHSKNNDLVFDVVSDDDNQRQKGC